MDGGITPEADLWPPHTPTQNTQACTGTGARARTHTHIPKNKI